MNDWSLYILKTGINTLYTGIAVDVERRLEEHRSGRAGAKYLRAKGPLELAYQVTLGNRAIASRAEYRVKQLTRSAKQDLINHQPDAETLLGLIGLEAVAEDLL
ncbi:MAG: GIY-YIG nuclease family protein [Nevskiales bacterium]